VQEIPQTLNKTAETSIEHINLIAFKLWKNVMVFFPVLECLNRINIKIENNRFILNCFKLNKI